VTDLLRPYSRISKRLLSFQGSSSIVLTRLVDSVPDPVLLIKSDSTGNRTRTSGSVARPFDQQTTEVVYFLLHNIYKFRSYLTENTVSPFCSQEPLTTRPQGRSTFFYITYTNSVCTSQETQYISVQKPGILTTRPQRRSTFFYIKKN
jgi:hypothetical protein